MEISLEKQARWYDRISVFKRLPRLQGREQTGKEANFDARKAMLEATTVVQVRIKTMTANIY